MQRRTRGWRMTEALRRAAPLATLLSLAICIATPLAAQAPDSASIKAQQRIAAILSIPQRAAEIRRSGVSDSTLRGVLESAVVGIPHPDFGEAVIAAVVARGGAELSEAGIIGELKAQLANYKVPKRVIVLAELPRNAMGKVQKNVLRERYGG